MMRMQNEVGEITSRFNHGLMHRVNGFGPLIANRLFCSSSLVNITSHSTLQSDIFRSINKDLQIK